MSRTYRWHLVSEYKIRGIIYDNKNIDEIDKLYREKHGILLGIWYYSGHRYTIKKCRDKKPWYKPNKEFKQMNRRLERAEVKNALRSGIEALPMFRKSDVWEWT